MVRLPGVVLAFVLVASVACGPASPPAAPSEPGAPSSPPPPIAPPTRAAPPPSEERVEDFALRVARSLAACDRGAVLADTITYEEIVALTTKPFDHKDLDEPLTALLDSMCAELHDHHATVVSARVDEMKHLKAADDEKVKRDLDAAIIKLTIEAGGTTAERGPGLYFFKTDRGWRFSPIH